ncbi:MAG: acetyltransferase [Phycisphaeraceae bacterium]|nr:acetyltransferase [Phycisphaeraceae bacterium]
MNQRLLQTGFLAIYGAGGHGLVVAEAATAAGWRVIGLIDAAKPIGTKVGLWQVIGEDASQQPSVEVIVAVGDNTQRQLLTKHLIERGRTLAVVIHPSAMLSPSAMIGTGTFIGPMSVLHAECYVGQGVIINTGAIVEHHCNIGNFAHIAPRVALAGNVDVGDLTLIGIGACVRPQVKIGSRCTIGAGSVVVKNIADGKRMMGVPARE